MYDADGQLKAVSDPASNTGVFNWDAVGNLLSISRTATTALTVIQLTPARGAIGDTVTIAGTGFSTTPSSNTVRFNGTTATVSAATARSLTVTVPAGATTGTVSVTTPSAEPVTSNQTFTVGGGAAPAITSVSPTLATAGTTVTVTGSNFATSAAAELARTGGTTSEITTTSATSTKFKVPANAGGAVFLATAYGSATGPDVFVPPDGLATTSIGPKIRLAESTPKTMTFSTAGKFGLALIDGHAGQKLSVTMTLSTIAGGGTVTLYAPDGTSIVTYGWFSGTGGMVDAITLPSTGTYTLLVNPYGATGHMSLTTYDVHDVTGTVTPSVAGDSEALTLGVPGQNGRLTFSGTADQQVSLAMSNSSINFGWVSILDPNGDVVGPSMWFNTAGGMLDTVTLPSTGTYTAVVDPGEADAGHVTVTAYDVHDVVGSMAPSTAGDVKSLTVGTPGQNGRYAVSATAGQQVSVAISGSTFDNVWTEWRNPDGSMLAYYPSVWSGSGFFDQVRLPTAGTYTLLVDPMGLTTGSATITGYDASDVTGTIAPSVAGDSEVLTLGVPGQNALLTFSGTADQELSLAMSDSSIDFGWVTIFDPSGTALPGGVSWFNTSGGGAEPVTLPSTGTYTVLVDPSETATGHVTLTATLGGSGFAARRASADVSDAATGGSGKSTEATTQAAPSSVDKHASSSGQRAKSTKLHARPRYRSMREYLRAGAGGVSANQAARAAAEHRRARTVASGSRRALSGAAGSALTATFRPLHPLMWHPGAENRRGLAWRTDREATPWDDLALPRATGKATALAGRALRLDGLPLAGVRVSIEGAPAAATTGDDGRFLLSGVPAGRRVLIVDGAPASRHGARYGTFEVGVELTAHRTTDLEYSLWMTALDSAGDRRIASPTRTETVLTTPRIPGLEVRLPAGTVIRTAAGKVVRKLNITAVPVDRPPFPLPAHVEVPLYFTVQPGRAYLSKGAQIIYPNYGHLPAGQRVDFWNYDAHDRGWYVYGHGTVTADAKQVIPDRQVRVWEFTGAMISSDAAPPASGPTVGGGATGGDPVDLQTGLFTYEKTDLMLSDTIPVVVDHTYRQGDSNSYSFGLGAASSYDMRLWSDHNYQEADLVMPDGGRVHYVRTSEGTGFTDAVYEASTTPGRFFGSKLSWRPDVAGGWDVTLKDGTTYVFGDTAPLQAIRDRYGNQVTITRTSGQTGNITQITSPHGRWVRFTYDTSNRIKQARDNGSRVVNYTYDTSGRLKTITDAASRVTTFGYNTSNQLTSVKNGRNNTYVTASYTNGRVASQTTADGGTYGFAYTLDGSGKVTATTVTDPRGTQRKVTFNADGYPSTDIQALGTAKEQTTTFERQSGSDQVLSVTDPRGRKTAYQYDADGNVTQVTLLADTGSARSTDYTYDLDFDQLASVTDALGHTTSFEYGDHGELASMTDALGHETTYEHQPDGQLKSITTPLGKTTTYGYEYGDLVSITDPLGRRATQFVDNVGRIGANIEPGGQRTAREFDADDGVTKVTDPLGAATTYGRDGDGNVTSITDARTNATTATYDAMDRLVSQTDPLTHATQGVYDKNGNLTQLTDRRGKVSTFVYDVLNRRTQAKYGVVGGTAESTVDYTYDNANRMTQVVDSADGTYTLSYDDFDRLTSSVGPLGTVGYGYDAADRRTSMTVPGQSQTNYGYDDADRLTSLTRGSQSVSFAYDDADRPAATTLVDGIVQQYGYDDASQLTSIAYKLGATTLGDLAYDYDVNGRLSAMWGSYARTGIPSAMASATYNAANERTAQGATTLTYDNEGNLTSDGTSTYTWDARGQLSAISGGSSASFAYDPFGRRRSRTVGGTTTKFLSDAASVVQESVGGSVTADLLSGGVDELFARTTSAGTDSYMTDALGSTLALANGSGAVQTSYTYEPFGAATSSGTASGNPYRFTGREDDGTGLDYYRARYYSPAMGRFISQDPLGAAADGPNLYAYTGNDPTNGIDPSGLMSSAGGGVGFGTGSSIGGIDIGSNGIGFAPGTFLGFHLGPVLGPPAPPWVMNADPGAGSPVLNPGDFAGKTPDEIHELAVGKGLIPKGSDPRNGQGSYIDPVTGRQRVISQPKARSGPHMHVNDPSGQRLGLDGNPISKKKSGAHLPIG